MKKFIANILVIALLCTALGSPLCEEFAEEVELQEEVLTEGPIETEEQEPTSESIAAEALSVTIPSAATADEGSLDISASVSASGAELYWQCISAQDAQGRSEAELEALWEYCSEGTSLHIEGITAADDGRLFRCVAVLGDEIAASGRCTIRVAATEEKAEAQPEETEAPAEVEPIPVLETETPAQAVETEASAEAEDATGSEESAETDAEAESVELIEESEAADTSVADMQVLTISAEVTDTAVLLTAVGAGEGASIRWQYLKDDVWTDAGTGAVLTIEKDAYGTYRCIAAADDVLMVSESYSYDEERIEARGGAALPIEALSFTEAPESVLEYHTVQLHVTVEPQEAVHKTVLWMSSDSNIATVDGNGKVYGVAAGTCKITASSAEDQSVRAEMFLTVEESPIGIVLNLGTQSEVRLVPGQVSRTVTAVVTDHGAYTAGKLVWSTDNAAVAKVNASTGEVTAVKVGSAVITATSAADPAISKSYTVTVVASKTNLPTAVYVKTERTTLGVGEKLPVSVSFNANTYDSYVMTTTNPAAVMLTNDGSIVAKGEGTAVIKAITLSGKAGYVVITVKAAPTELSISANELTIAAGDTRQLKASVNAGAYPYGVFESTKPSVAEIDASGKVTANAPGTATLKARTYNGLEEICEVTVVPEVSEFGITQESMTIGRGEKLQLDTYMNSESMEADTRITYKSSNTRVLVVDATGTIVAKNAGTVTVSGTVDYKKELTDKVTVVVKNAPTKVTLKSSAPVLGLGESAQLAVTFNAGAGGSYELTSSDKAVASVSQDGMITAHKPGSVTFRATAYNNIYGETTIEIREAPKSLTFDRETLTLSAGDSLTVTASVNEGAAGTPTYRSGDTSVARVDANGRITAVAKGKTVITARVYNGVETTMEVEVLPAPTEIRLSTERTTIGLGETIQLTAENDVGSELALTWSSSRAGYISVDANGRVKALRTGSAVIYAKAYNGVVGKITIVATAAPTAVTLKVSATELGVGEKAYATVSYPKGTGAFKYYVEDDSILSISEDGVILAKAQGTTRIKAEAYNGRYALATITVKAAPESLVYRNSSVTLGAGEKRSVPAYVNEGAAGSVTYMSADKSIATVDANGNITAIATGTTEILAETYNDCKDSVSVTVKPAPTKITVSAERTTLGLGETLKLTAVNDAFEELPITWSSSRAAYLSVDAEGNITAKGTGATVIYAKAYNGVTGKITISVVAAPVAVNLKLSSAKVGVGDSVKAAVSYTAGAGSYKLYVEDESIATVDDAGVITGRKVGTTRVKAEAYNGKYAIATLEVIPAPTDVLLDKGNIKLAAGDSTTIAAALNAGAVGSITFASTNESVATVDANGKITAVAEGKATVRAMAYNGVSADCIVTVCPAVTAMKITADHNPIGRGEKVQLSVETDTDAPVAVKFSAPSSRTAVVSADGVVTGLRAGSLTVTATAYNGVKATYLVSVVSYPSSVSLNVDKTTLGVRETAQATVKLSANSAGAVTYASSDESVLLVSQTGEITAVGEGTAMVGVKTYNGLTATKTITVVAAPTKLTLSRSSCKIAVGDTYRIQAATDTAVEQSFTYQSLAPEVASVDANGVVTALKADSWATIRVKAYNGVYANLSVTTCAEVTSISLTTPASVLGVSETVQLGVLLNKDSNLVTMPTFSVSPATVGSVSDSGVFTAKAVGTCVVTAKTYNGLAATVSIEVRKAPTRISILASKTTIQVGETATVSVTLGTGEYSRYSFASSDTTVATISQDGIITGVKDGTSRITVTCYNGLSATGTITVGKTTSGVVDSDVSAKIEAVIALAQKQLNKTYASPCAAPTTFDCSGLVRYCYLTEGGVTLYASAYTQGYDDRYKKISTIAELKRGDVVFFNTNLEDSDLCDHSGIYLGDKQFIHASSAAGKVIVSSMASGYYVERFSWGRRILGT